MNFGGVTNDTGSFRMKIQRKIQGEPSIFMGSFSETESVVCDGIEKVWTTKDAEVENAYKTRLSRFFLAFICDFFSPLGCVVGSFREWGWGWGSYNF